MKVLSFCLFVRHDNLTCKAVYCQEVNSNQVVKSPYLFLDMDKPIAAFGSEQLDMLPQYNNC